MGVLSDDETIVFVVVGIDGFLSMLEASFDAPACFLLDESVEILGGLKMEVLVLLTKCLFWCQDS